jgi:acetoacetate decarboxylase
MMNRNTILGCVVVVSVVLTVSSCAVGVESDEVDAKYERAVIVARYYDSESVSVSWETRPELIAELIPPPLEPYGDPVVRAGVSYYPNVENPTPYVSTSSYALASLSVRCTYKDAPGGLSLTLIEDDDIAVYTGREMLGFPKKMGVLGIERDGRKVHAWAERRGVRVFEVEATLTEELPELPPVEERQAPLTGQLTADSEYRWGGYNFKFMRHSGAFFREDFSPADVFDFGPVMTQQARIGGPGFSRSGTSVDCDPATAKVITRPSPSDSLWAKLEMVKLLSVEYSKGGSFTMLSGRVMKDVVVDPATFEEFSRYKYDY